MTTSKITFTDANRATDCVHWVIENIGPKTNSPGSSLRGEGWHFWTRLPDPFDAMTYAIELNEHVDEETRLLFMLKWA